MKLYKVVEKMRGLRNKLLWKSMKKEFAHVGSNVSAASLPFVSGSKHISIGNNCYLGNDIRIEAWETYQEQVFTPSVLIDDDVVLTERVYISCIDKIVVGSGTLIGRDVFITDNSHGVFSLDSLKVRPSLRALVSKGPVIIGKNVWIGRNVTVLSGVSIGDNVVIGANSLVNKDVPPNSLVCGTPAKIIRKVE